MQSTNVVWTVCCWLLPLQIWHHTEAGWQQEGGALAGHTDWVRDVAWAPNLGLPMSTIASCGQDGQVGGTGHTADMVNDLRCWSC